MNGKESSVLSGEGTGMTNVTDSYGNSNKILAAFAGSESRGEGICKNAVIEGPCSFQNNLPHPSAGYTPSSPLPLNLLKRQRR